MYNYYNPIELGTNPNHYIRVTDMNGNGIKEILHVSRFMHQTYLGLYEFDPQANQILTVFEDGYYHDDSDGFELFTIKPGDFTGDGKTDLLANTEEDTSTIFTLDENNELAELFSDGYPTRWHRVFTGDFNGDGITDVLTFAYANPDVGWELKYFDGKGGWKWLEEEDVPITKTIDPEDSSINYIISDFNGSGKSDIAEIYKPGGHGSKDIDVVVFYSKGLNFISSEIFSIDSELYVVGTKAHTKVIDFAGDGKTELFFKSPYSIHLPPDKILSFFKHDTSHLTHSFENSLGAKSSVEYNSLANNPYYNIHYEKGDNAEYPLADIQPPMYVVTSESHDIGDTHTEIKTYKYKGAKVHKQGKGFLGFEKTTETNKLSGIKTEYHNDIYMPQGKLFYPYRKKTESFDASDETLTETSNTLNHKYYGHSTFAFFPYIESSFSRQYDYNTSEHLVSSRNEYSYNSYGNLIHKEEVAHPNFIYKDAPSSAFDHQTNISTTYKAPDTHNWIISQPEKITVEKRYKYDEIVKSSGEFVYYQQNHTHFPLVKEVLNIPDDNPNDVLVTKEAYDYDDYGNRISVTRSAPNDPDLTDRQTFIGYSSAYQHRFPTSRTNPLGHTTTFSYDQMYGWKTLIKDANNLSTHFEHHPSGISKKIVYPDDVQEKIVRRWACSHEDAPENALYYTWSQQSGEAEIITFYDKTGRELRTVTYGFDENKIYRDKIYNEKGLLYKASLPYFPGDQIYYITYTYDDIGRVTEKAYPDNTNITTQYSGNKVITTNQLNQTREQKFNALGWLYESTDNNGTTVKYDYYSDGELKSAYIENQSETAVSIEYNSRRQRILIDDPNYGEETYTYNAFDELVSKTTPKNETVEYSYDIIGRMLSRTEPEGTTYWVYSEAPGKKGTLQSVFNQQHHTEYEYDDLLRPIAVKETIGSEIYQTNYTYDEFGRIRNTAHPSGFTTTNQYDHQGYLTHIRSAKDNSVLWQTKEMNSYGQITDFSKGNGLNTTREYEPETLRPVSILTQKQGNDPVQDFELGWDEVGNLEYRKKWINRQQNQSLTESFVYDDINRLEAIYLDNVLRGEHQYDDQGLGNLVYKKSDGEILFEDAQYGEGGAGPHALTSADTYGGVFPEDVQTIDYSSFNKITTITEGEKSLTIQYGTHRQRIEQEYVYGPDNITKRWAGACEYIVENGKETILTYIAGPEGVFAVHVIHEDESSEIHYISKDYLGSWHAITDEEGSLIQELSFDAWGNRRNPATWESYEGALPAAVYDRGFTGHEHLYGFNLINMGGRVYDPIVSRFLSPDPYIQAPGFSQSFNRYAYVWNNPMKYVDPDGEWVSLVIGAVVGGVVNWIAHGAEFTWEGLAYFGVGAVAGALGAGIGAGVSTVVSGAGTFGAGFLGTAASVGTGAASGAAAGAAAGFTSGFITDFGNQLIAGESVTDALLSGLETGGWGALIGGVTGGILGGIDAMLDDRCFWTGSPHKQYYVTDGETLIHVEDWYRGSDNTKEQAMKIFGATNEPFDITVKIPKGFEHTGYVHKSVGDYAPPIFIESTADYVKYQILFTEGNYGFGAVVMQRTQVIDHTSIFRIQLFHNTERSWSWIYLKSLENQLKTLFR